MARIKSAQTVKMSAKIKNLSARAYHHEKTRQKKMPSTFRMVDMIEPGQKISNATKLIKMTAHKIGQKI